MRIEEPEVVQGDCLEQLGKGTIRDVQLTFLDPPFNQGKEYEFFDDNLPPEEYWGWLQEIIGQIHKCTVDGGSIYFMQREKNVGWMLKVLGLTGWTFQNLIIWKKFTSAVPSEIRFGKSYQLIVYATKGENPNRFNRLRIDYPLRPNHKHGRPNGIYAPDTWDDTKEDFASDYWDDIKELTSGYFAGDEALRTKQGTRIHKQQSPVELLLRIILSSTAPGDVVLDPFAGSGTTLVVAKQLQRRAIGVEIDPTFVDVIRKRVTTIRPADNIMRFRDYYRSTPSLDEIWPPEKPSKPVRSLETFLSSPDAP